MCDEGPDGDVGGITTIRLMPAKLKPAAWHDAQLFVIPLWLIIELLNLAPSPTGVLATLEPGPTWQVSHAVVIGMWVAGGPTIAKLADGIAKPATTLAA